MKYWILLISLFIFGCGGGDNAGDSATVEEVVEEA